MNYLVARLKGKRGEILKVLSTKLSAFEQPDGFESKEYDPRYKLEDDERFVLENFSRSKYKNELIAQTISTTNLNQIEKNQYSEINYLCSIQGDLVFFQKMNASQLYHKKWFQISGTPDLMKDAPILVINEEPDAVYNKQDDTLAFRNIARIKTVFYGVEELYREATDKEVDTFLKKDFIKPTDDYSVASVKTNNRKRIALAMDTLKRFKKEDQQNIFKYIKDYCPELKFENDAFNISSEEDLKKVLFGIEERYYTTIRTHEKRLANSVTKIG